MTTRSGDKTVALLAAACCALFFCLFTFPITDGDFFWHLASGRWIAEHHAIPSRDMLSFTVTDHNPFRPESARIPFLLKQYWLGQLVLFGIWQFMGSAGIVLLRAATYTGVLAGLFLWMRRQNRGLSPLVIILLAGLLLREIPNERPQLFSFLFTPLVLLLLEAAAGPGRARRPALVGLPLTMLLWANTHGAYLLGVCLIGLRLVPTVGSDLSQRRKPDLPFVAAGLGAMLITLANPAGPLAWLEFFRSNRAYLASVYENLSPWFVAVRLHDFHPAYWLYLALCLAVLVRQWRKMALADLLTLLALSLLSLTALRYLIFPFLAAPLLTRYLPEQPLQRGSAAAVIALFALWLGLTWNNHLLEFRPRHGFPEAAVTFIRQQRPAAQLFNHYDWGGYISAFAPSVKTFIDGRGLVEELSLLQDELMGGKSWQEAFRRYDINTVVIPGMGETTGAVYPLAEQLNAAPDWRLVFADADALVFVREIPANAAIIDRYALERSALQRHLVGRADRLIAEDPGRAGYWLTKANALQLLGERREAAAAYRRLLALDPANAWAKRMLAIGGN